MNATLNKVNEAGRGRPVRMADSFFLFLLEDPDAVATDRHRDADHGLEQLDRDLFLGLVDLHDAGLFSLERAGNQFDDVAFHDPADDRLRSEVRLDLREGDSRRFSLALHDAASPTQTADDFLQAVGVHALDVYITAEVRGHEDREHADVLCLGPGVDGVGDGALMADRGLHREDRLPRTEAQGLRVEGARVAL